MNRKAFLKYSALTSAALSMQRKNSAMFRPTVKKTARPLAITMWDFSWLERRRTGAGYEDWDKALNELVVRGYNAVRIDAYPHLVAHDATKEYTLLPVWNTQDWGSPDINKVTVQPALNHFIAKCKKRGIMVGLSCWYRRDTDNVLMEIDGPRKMAANWITTLQSIEKDGLLDAILYVDLCNEWPGDLWCPFFKNDPPEHSWGLLVHGQIHAIHEGIYCDGAKRLPAHPLVLFLYRRRPGLIREKRLVFFWPY